jgi:hypothetical protein
MIFGEHSPFSALLVQNSGCMIFGENSLCFHDMSRFVPIFFSCGG